MVNRRGGMLLERIRQAEPDSGDIRITSIGRDRTVTETWHTDRCPTYTIEQILMEASAETPRRPPAAPGRRSQRQDPGLRAAVGCAARSS
ncbi:hypothetical protein ACFVHB_17355 [Kitasatospora sp. NPDC127111]|uniref:hypothetical protein n=1 Tax=Kitasatospora sp. NPDC127111 TaxID=3345363 RepID=UPI00363799FD